MRSNSIYDNFITILKFNNFYNQSSMLLTILLIHYFKKHNIQSNLTNGFILSKYHKFSKYYYVIFNNTQYHPYLDLKDEDTRKEYKIYNSNIYGSFIEDTRIKPLKDKKDEIIYNFYFYENSFDSIIKYDKYNYKLIIVCNKLFNKKFCTRFFILCCQ